MAKLTILLLVCAVLELSNTTPLMEQVKTESSSVCSTGWFKHGHRCFTYIRTERTWAESEQYCVFQGANLASIHSTEENHFIQEMIRRQTHDFPRVWIGGQDATQERLWLWSDGSRFYYQENRWNDDRCTLKKPPGILASDTQPFTDIAAKEHNTKVLYPTF
uniref:C-type lectin domain-containing protein n=1 Tax=Oncorhynchus tshawytscha TaxID=74940 RepID=A0A8C8K038_ONCTS